MVRRERLRTLRALIGAVAISLPLAIHVGALAGILQLAALSPAGWAWSLSLAAAAVDWRWFVR